MLSERLVDRLSFRHDTSGAGAVQVRREGAPSGLPGYAPCSQGRICQICCRALRQHWFGRGRTPSTNQVDGGWRATWRRQSGPPQRGLWPRARHMARRGTAAQWAYSPEIMDRQKRQNSVGVERLGRAAWAPRSAGYDVPDTN